jgi:hypothetical protein
LRRRGEGGEAGKQSAEGRRTRRNGRASRRLSARGEGAADAARRGDGTRADARALEEPPPAVARAGGSFVNGAMTRPPA